MRTRQTLVYRTHLTLAARFISRREASLTWLLTRSEDSIARHIIKMGKPKQSLCAIFVHAGAGFHSRENEAQHLEACQRYVYPCFFFNGLGI